MLLWGRDPDRLASVAESCRRKGAEAVVRSLDLLDTATAIAALAMEDDAAAITIAVLAAGLGDICPANERVEPSKQIMRLGLVNFVTPAAMAATLADRMAIRGRGNIIFVGSAASFHALPFAASYAASKAGLAHFAQALRIAVAANGVKVTLVSPGFIDTAAGRRVAGPKPLLMQPSYVAARIAKAAEQGKAHLILPRAFAALRLIERLLPGRVRDRLLLSLAPPGE